LFLTETAQRADVFLPAASAYEKSGTFTNVCGEIQRLRPAARTMGTKADLEIIGILAREMKANIGLWKSENVFNEIRTTVHGYDVPTVIIETGGAAVTAPVNGNVQATRADLVESAKNNLFHSGTLGRFCKTLNAVAESPGTLYGQVRSDPEPVTLSNK
jgi:predicted molibdopterin-dependent oxidoreductase YjgC